MTDEDGLTISQTDTKNIWPYWNVTRKTKTAIAAAQALLQALRSELIEIYKERKDMIQEELDALSKTGAI
jgi:hypothetical protein